MVRVEEEQLRHQHQRKADPGEPAFGIHSMDAVVALLPRGVKPEMVRTEKKAGDKRSRGRSGVIQIGAPAAN